eukprot:364600-Chlamydomonas_euryale.AAC.3
MHQLVSMLKAHQTHSLPSPSGPDGRPALNPPDHALASCQRPALGHIVLTIGCRASTPAGRPASTT